jgi:uncharacterized metal-binding protein
MDSCCSTGRKVMLFPCSGGSNVGQLSNEAARRLDGEGNGQFFCLAGIGGHIPGIVKSAQAADAVVAIDGCAVGCAKAALEAAEVPITRYVVVTELGIEKGHHFAVTAEQIDAVCDAVAVGPAAHE